MTAPDQARPVERCRSCDQSALRPFLDLGRTPIANALLGAPDEAAPTHPLAVGFCESCTLVQLMHELPAEVLFDEDYPYFSSFSEGLVRHAKRHVDGLVDARGLGPDSLVVEVASNDGYLLRHVLDAGVRAVGIEPSPGPAQAAREAGVITEQVFLSPTTAAAVRAEHGPADVVIANNVMAHVPDLNGFVQGLRTLLADDGVLTVENPGVQYLLEDVEFDTVYHEHFCYFSCAAVDALMTRNGLHLNDVELFRDLHGGTLRWHCSRTPGRSARLEEQLEGERAAGVTTFDRYARFGAQVEQLQGELTSLLSRLRDEGRSIAAYGAAAKGATLLNSTGIGTELLDFVVDRNPHKQGRFMPGSALPIVGPEELLARQPDYVLLLAWNVATEIQRQQAEYTRRGGRFVVPLPVPGVLPVPDPPS